MKMFSYPKEGKKYYTNTNQSKFDVGKLISDKVDLKVHIARD